MTRLRGVPSTRALTAQLVWLQLEDLDWLELEESGMEIRLQVVDGSWAVHYGDPGYDLDHRGFWGAAWLPRTGTVPDIARDLIEQVRDAAAMADAL